MCLENSNCIIDGIICDGASTNRKMWKEFGISGAMESMKNYFTHPLDESRKVFAFSDIPHIFKNIRNRLHDKKILRVNIVSNLINVINNFFSEYQMNADCNPIRWSHYIDVLNADTVHAGVARAVPKVTKDHLFLSNIMKMRVRLMTQVI